MTAITSSEYNPNSKHASNCLSLFKKDEVAILQDFEKYLQKALVIPASHEDLLSQTNLSRGHRMQLAFMTLQSFWSIPRLGFFCSLYTPFYSEETATRLRFYLADYFEELGLLGRTLQIAYFIFGLGCMADQILLRRSERSQSLSFLIDILRLQNGNYGLEESERMHLLQSFKKKIIFTKMMVGPTNLSTHVYDVVDCSLFLWNKRPPVMIALVAVTNLIIMCIDVITIEGHYFWSYLSYIMTTDYLKCRVNSIKKNVRELSNNITNSTIMEVLAQIDDLKDTFRVYNRTMNPLLRNMMYMFRGAVCCLFFLTTIEMHPFLKFCIVTTVTGLSICIMLTAMYISGLKTKLLSLYEELNTVSATQEKNISVKTRFCLMKTIKEIGTSTLNKDGHFIIGLADGSGPAISSMEVFELTLEIVFNTLMFMQMVYN